MRHFYKAFSSLLSDYLQNKKLLKGTKDLLLLEVLQNKQNYFSDKEIKRIHFYTSYAPIFCGYTYSTMRGSSITVKEHSLMSHLSILTPIFDDYFDEEGSDTEILSRMINAPKDYIITNEKERLSISFYKKIQEQVIDHDALKENIYKLFIAQQEGKSFHSSTVYKDVLKKNTFDRGGYSSLLYRNMLNHPMKDGEQEAIYHFGGMIQWLDDIFDIYEDYQATIFTMPNSTKDIYLLATDYEAGLKEMIHLFKNLDYKKEHINLFLDKLMIIFVRGFVCIEQLKKTQDKYGNGFDPSKYERKDLICDMEKVSNLYKLYTCFSDYRSDMKKYAAIH